MWEVQKMYSIAHAQFNCVIKEKCKRKEKNTNGEFNVLNGLDRQVLYTDSS